MLKCEIAVGTLLKFLDTPNWHVKEESLRLLIAAYLVSSNEGKIEFDQKFPLTKVAKLLDDESSKVVLAALESLTVICYSVNKLECLEILEGIVAKEFYEVIMDALQQGKIAYVDHT